MDRDALIKEVMTLRSRYTFLENQIENELRLEIQRLTRLETACHKMQEQLWETQAQLQQERLMNLTTSQNNTLAAANQGLQDKVTEVTRDRQKEKPLADVGVAIRLRFLENARETALSTPRNQLDNSIVSNGNSAAHRGNREDTQPCLAWDWFP